MILLKLNSTFLLLCLLDYGKHFKKNKSNKIGFIAFNQKKKRFINVSEKAFNVKIKHFTWYKQIIADNFNKGKSVFYKTSRKLLRNWFDDISQVITNLTSFM